MSEPYPHCLDGSLGGSSVFFEEPKVPKFILGKPNLIPFSVSRGVCFPYMLSFG